MTCNCKPETDTRVKCDAPNFIQHPETGYHSNYKGNTANEFYDCSEKYEMLLEVVWQEHFLCKAVMNDNWNIIKEWLEDAVRLPKTYIEKAINYIKENH